MLFEWDENKADENLTKHGVSFSQAVLAFRDVKPQAPVHVLIVPKCVIPRLADATEDDVALLGKLLLASRKVAEKLDLLKSGYRVVINSGPDAGESVPHLHVHVLGKRALAWPPG